MQIVAPYAMYTPSSYPVSVATRGCTSSFNKIALVITPGPIPDKAVMKPIMAPKMGSFITFLAVHLKSPGTNSYPIFFLCSYSLRWTTTAIMVIVIEVASRIEKRIQSVSVHLVAPMIEGSLPEPRSN